jgi:hypothetical protein
VASPRQAQLGSVVVRAWVEPDAPARDVRARVLLIREPDAVPQEIGVGAGIDQVLELVSDAVLSLGEPG